nr:hypothetical protein CJLB15_00050 [Campylobacter phage CJLB-15]
MYFSLCTLWYQNRSIIRCIFDSLCSIAMILIPYLFNNDSVDTCAASPSRPYRLQYKLDLKLIDLLSVLISLI